MSRNHHHSFLVTAAAFHYCLATAAQQWWVASKEAIQDDFFPFFKLVARREAWLDSKKKWLEKFSSSLHPRQQSTLNAERNENHTTGRCLKITEKVSFNIASEASYVYILSGQKKMPKMVQFGEFLKNWSLRSNSVTRLVSFLKGRKLVKNAKITKIQMRHFE